MRYNCNCNNQVQRLDRKYTQSVAGYPTYVRAVQKNSWVHGQVVSYTIDLVRCGRPPPIPSPRTKANQGVKQADDGRAHPEEGEQPPGDADDLVEDEADVTLGLGPGIWGWMVPWREADGWNGVGAVCRCWEE